GRAQVREDHARLAQLGLPLHELAVLDDLDALGVGVTGAHGDALGDDVGERPVNEVQALHGEALQLAVAPLLVAGRGERRRLVRAERRPTLVGQPTRLVEARDQLLHGGRADRRVAYERLHQPTLPSISSSMRRFSSTAYSSGSSLATGSRKPRTMSAM